ncbi:hypothetical protein GCM10010145_62060 [Streptomyces ruber]|uniref:Carboxymuconolactone decarboxylase-like domain-containing protein n=2 Tax=Streptomyces TaxID=1883 RepID=A0A918BRC9_9ACTN|nr:hypothetical protein GCM10010145_62060 [Streptomyces ruber]
MAATGFRRAPDPGSGTDVRTDRLFDFLSHAVNSYAVGELFARDVLDVLDVLDVRTRRLALVAAFAALGLDDFIKIHGGYALNAGATEEELKEIVCPTTIPGGFPAPSRPPRR